MKYFELIVAFIGGLCGLYGIIQELRKIYKEEQKIIRKYFWVFIKYGAVSVSFLITGYYLRQSTVDKLISEKREIYISTNKIIDDNSKKIQTQGDTLKLQARAISNLRAMIGIPSDPKILFYEHANFKGSALPLTIDGDIANQFDLTDTGFNDLISSIKIEGNLYAIVHKDKWLQGERMTIKQTIPLLDKNWNDAISSIQIHRK